MKTGFWTLTLLLISLIVDGCSPREQWRRTEGAVWNTLYHITYRAADNLDDSINAVMHAVESSLSPFDSLSVISRINRNESDIADSAVIKVFDYSVRLNALSAGMFDPTVAPLVNLWGFGYKHPADEAEQPSLSEISEQLLSVGIGDCRRDGLRIIKKSPDTEFNFSAITKGLGCDMIGEMLRRNGCRDYMIEIGGEIALSGTNPHGGPWRIMVDAPEPSDSAIVHKELTTLELTDCGIATSGNYRNYRNTDFGCISHTINPRTGFPVTTEPTDTLTLSATVIAPSCMEADAIATAVMAMPLAETRKMLSSLPGVRLLAVVATADKSMILISLPD